MIIKGIGQCSITKIVNLGQKVWIKLEKREFAELIADITENPEAGTFIGNNCNKICLAIGSKGKGKSGSARVITYLYIETETFYLLTIYDKKRIIRPKI
jgi:hypothetical protein